MNDGSIILSGYDVVNLLSGRMHQIRIPITRAKLIRPVGKGDLIGEELSLALNDCYELCNIGGDMWRWSGPSLSPASRIGYRTYEAHLGYAVGDRLWVREEYGFIQNYVYPSTFYRADWATNYPNSKLENPKFEPSWVSPARMPRVLSRFTLVIEKVRVERVQEITLDDVLASGCYDLFDKSKPSIELFRDFWNLEFRPSSSEWDRNPWVMAITFQVNRVNIDRMGGVPVV